MAQVTRTHPDDLDGERHQVALVGSAAKRNKRQQQGAAAITADASCTPVFVRAAIVGKARMPRAALEITTPAGDVLGHVALANTSAAFNPTQRFWLVGEPTPGSVVALVSEGATQVILPGSRLRSGPVTEPEWSPLACRMLGWQRIAAPDDPTDSWHPMLGEARSTPNNPAFLAAVESFRTAAVLIPVLFFLVCFPYLFVIRPLVEAGISTPLLLALPVLGGGLMTAWSAHCRRRLVEEAEAIEMCASRFGKEIAFTQSYWSGMRKPAAVWDGQIPDAITASTAAA